MKTVLFTDLDGTLLDLETYSVSTAAPAVRALQKAGVAIVFCSSKTLVEQEVYLQALRLRTPVIVENGSAVVWPADTPLRFPDVYGTPTASARYNTLVLGTPYQAILTAVRKHAPLFPYTLKYYGNSTAEEIAQITGLDGKAVLRAMDRKYSETIFNVPPGDPHLHHFEKVLQEAGLQCMPGSRYITITGTGGDKGRAVGALIEAYRSQGAVVRSYGVGDSRNDLEMLRVVDEPRLVQRPDGTWADISVHNMIKVRGVGPHGWKMVAEEILHAVDG